MAPESSTTRMRRTISPHRVAGPPAREGSALVGAFLRVRADFWPVVARCFGSAGDGSESPRRGSLGVALRERALEQRAVEGDARGVEEDLEASGVGERSAAGEVVGVEQ